MKNIVIYMDYVVAFGVRVDRPSWMSRLDWECFWSELDE